MKRLESLEQQYILDTPLPHRKKLGQFFTPDAVVAVLQAWVTAGNPATVLDPAAGTGKLLDGFPEQTALTGYDVDEAILRQAAAALDNKSVQLNHADFLSADWEARYPGIICNPPYIKFKSYPNKADYFDLFQKKMDLTLSGYTNLYVLFLLKGIYQLAEKGRAAFIVPTEFLNSAYGEPVRSLLAEKGNLTAAAVTDFSLSWFDEAATTSTLLFIDNSRSSGDTAFYRLEKEQDLAGLQLALNGEGSFPAVRQASASELSASPKWQIFYREETDFSGYALRPLASFADVNRGIATGANGYFCLNGQKQQLWQLKKKNFLPCLTKANQIRTPFFDSGDWRKLYDRGEAVLLLKAEETDEETALDAYLAHGIETKVNQGYLTRRRRPWYKQEAREPAPILAKVFFRDDPFFIRNRSNAVNLTPFHCIYLFPEYEQDADILMAFLLTDLSRQIFSQLYRSYGRGLKKFEPGDLKTAPVVDLDFLSPADKENIYLLYQETKAVFFEKNILDNAALTEYFERILKKPHQSQ